jgi:2-polyprenyl-6-methoxyphenol hydroxylase-like FAD-dependent oxidoreductase
MPIRHAEIAGAGIAGLTTACVLAQRGWSVRVHERANDLREMGAGIYLKINSLLVLKEIGVLPTIQQLGVTLQRGVVTGRGGRELAKRPPLTRGETIVALRGDLHRALADRAKSLGVDFRTNSQAVSADPDGRLQLASGEMLAADLVVGADGFRSAVRDSLGLLSSSRSLPEGAIRIQVPRRRGEREGLTTEQWSGDCRLGIVPCSADDLYLYMIGPANHPHAGAIPVDKQFWIDRFPEERDVIARIQSGTGRYDVLHMVDVKGWCKGRVALIGDSVHAQPPNLGQGAGMAISNASALGKALDNEPSDVAGALRQWEAGSRPLTDEVQRWSYRYGLIFYALPAGGGFGEAIRASLIRMIGRVGFTSRKLAWLQRGGCDLAQGSPLFESRNDNERVQRV